jgi:DNA-binding LacI/PurR family transcriptional regulator
LDSGLSAVIYLINKRKPSLHDVAKLAGVSHTTVSRVLNHVQYVSATTKVRVEEAMLKLNYRPNLQARGLVTKNPDTIGILVVSDANLVGALKILSEVSVQASRSSFFTSITSFDGVGEESLEDATNRLLDQRLAGLVVISGRQDGLGQIVRMANGLPLVFCKAGPKNYSQRIKLENEEAAHRATVHLLELGHTKLIHFSGPKGLIDSDERRTGFERAMKEAGHAEYSIFEGDWTADSGFRIGNLLAESGVDFTAVFCGNDKMALGLIHSLNERGLEVPRNVSIVGFDDLEQAKHFRPALTTVRQDFSEFGFRALLLLQAQMGNLQKPELTPLQPQLVIRNSCSKPYEEGPIG